MASLVYQILIYLILATFVIGQTLRPQILGIQISSIDLFLPILASVNLFLNLKNKTKVSNKSLIYFLIFGLFSLSINVYFRQLNPFRPIFYFLRLGSLLSFFIFPLKLNQKTNQFLYLCLISNLIFGLIQYLIWPDFTYFDSLDWDPHLNRLVSTFYDPTFTGLIYLISFIIFFNWPKSKTRLFLLVLSYVAMALTYSRSTYLSFILASSIYSLKQKNFKYIFLALLLILSTIFILPRRAGEGSKLERTSSIYAKIENYKQGFSYINQSPIIGFGYNTLSQVKNTPSTDHSANGFDSSLLTILATTGILGLIPFLFFLKSLIYNPSIVINITIFSILLHSLFANSLLYPWILFLLALIYSKYRKSP